MTSEPSPTAGATIAPVSANRFGGKLVLVLLDNKLGPSLRDGRSLWGMFQELLYRPGDRAHTITVPKGFVTDLASIPRWGWIILPPDGPWVKAAIIHDYLYATGGTGTWKKHPSSITRPMPYTRAEADEILREAMENRGVGPIRRTIIYLAVRIGGGRGWRNPKPQTLDDDAEREARAGTTNGNAATPPTSDVVESTVEDRAARTPTAGPEIDAERIARERAEAEEATRAIPPEARAVNILFATNREQPLPGQFSDGRAEETFYGTAQVRIPDNHKIGKIERPLVIEILGLELFRQSEDADRHFIIQSVETIALDTWQQRVADRNAALLFIHGYNVSFDEALIHLGQIAWDLQTSATPVLFSWPSRGTLLDYRYDEDSVTYSTDTLCEVLDNIAASGIKRVHVLAHSMGCQLLLKALQHYRGALQFREVMLAAPDMDHQSFRKYANALVERAKRRVTLYASSIDKALALSREIAGGVPRAGDVPPGGPVTVDGMDTIDVTAIGGDIIGHGTFAQAGSILNDLNLLIRNGERPPNIRQILFRPVPEGTSPTVYWQYLKSQLPG